MSEQALVPATPDRMLQMLIDQKASPDTVNKMMDVVERWNQSKAVAEYHRAMNECQSEMPIVLHSSENKFLKASYAKLEAIQHLCKPIYTKHGFSLSWGEDTSDKPGYVRIVCDVMHDQGHTKRYQGDYPLDGTGAKGGSNMNPLQGRVSSNTYAQRDMLRSIFNLTIAGQDLDGNSPNAGITDDQIGKINTLIDQIRDKGGKHDHKTFLGIFGVQDLGEMTTIVAASAIRLLEGRKGGGK